MSFGINSAAQAPLSQLAQFEKDLIRNVGQASSGNRITSAAIDPSGLAIATSLQTQVSGFDAATQNVVNAQNAANVAEGALSTTQDNIQRLNTLAVQASSDLLSPTQRGALQAEADQLVKQINTVANNTTFNGINLLQGQFAGTTPSTPASAQVTADASLAGGGTLTNNVSAAANATAGTVQLTVNAGSSGNPATVAATFTDTATGTTTQLGTFTAGQTISANGTQITVGNISNTDSGQTATVQVTGATTGSSGQTANSQSGANEGDTTGLNLPNGSASANFLENIDFSSTSSAQNALGQISAAASSIESARATLGAQVVSLTEQANNNNVASVNLSASATAISGDSAAQRSTELNKLLIQRQISLDTLQNANTESGYLNRFFNTAQ